MEEEKIESQDTDKEIDFSGPSASIQNDFTVLPDDSPPKPVTTNKK